MKYLSHILFICLLVSYVLPASAQVYNKGAVYIPDSAYVATFGDLTNSDSGVIINTGNLYAYADIRNSGITGYHGGTLVLRGQAEQTLSGSSTFYTTNLTINNSSGVLTLNKRYSVSNHTHFISGILYATDDHEPLEFNPEGNGAQAIATTGTSDASHVIGYTFQLGKGHFVYPVGDSNRYQPIAANLSSNSAGMLCNYIPEDAGTAAFLNTGLSSTPLQQYNTFEYWNLSPAGTATGTVSVYYDGYNDFGVSANYDSTLKVAHKIPAAWVNEGGVVNGSQSIGTVTTEGEVSEWNIFTLGSIVLLSPLPTELLDFTLDQKGCDAILSWYSGVENNLAAFDIQYSTDGIRFKTIGSVAAQGSSSHYTFTYTAMNGRVFFRLVLRTPGNEYSYSEILMLHLKCTGDMRSVTIYPNPVTFGNKLHIRLSGYSGSITAILYDITGRQIYIEPLENGINSMDMDKIAAGTYQLCIVSAGQREVYKIAVTQ